MIVIIIALLSIAKSNREQNNEDEGAHDLPPEPNRRTERRTAKQDPHRYSNNIMWNLAHLICAQQAICYMRAGLQPIVPEKYIAPFFANTNPERAIASDEIQEIKGLKKMI